MAHTLWPRSAPTDLPCTTRWETSGNGLATGTTPTTIRAAHRPTLQAPRAGSSESCAAGPGAPAPGSSASRSAAGSTQASGSTTSAFGAPGKRQLRLDPFLFSLYRGAKGGPGARPRPKCFGGSMLPRDVAPTAVVVGKSYDLLLWLLPKVEKFPRPYHFNETWQEN